EADRIRFKNALSEARDRLATAGVDERTMRRCLAEAHELLDKEDFWLRLSDGLAAFISEDTFEYHVLPISFNSYVYVGEYYYTRPILPLFSDAQRFFILALSQNEVRFFEGNQSSITPVIINDLVPQNMEQALGLDDPNAKIQSHAAGDDTIYHGQGGGKDNKNQRLETYFRRIDKGLMEMLHDEHAPMLLAAVDYLVPIYQEINTYSNLLENYIPGNTEHMEATALHELAWRIISEQQERTQKNYQEQFEQKLAEGKASSFVYDIVPAALSGRIETLFVNKDSYLWGNYDEKNHTIHLEENAKHQSAQARELMDLAARAVYLQGGTVYNVPASSALIKDDANINAIYRY
ncbi:MAG: hypothetical protein AAF738_01515, partial [Bacteroidota bacterium]